MATLIVQTESARERNGRRYGLSVIRDDDGEAITYRMIVHTRTYDGLRVTSKWDTDPALLDAATKDEAITEAVTKANAYIRAIEGNGA